MFARRATGWQQTATIRPPVSANSDFFGIALARTDSTLAIGANGEGSGSSGVGGDPTRGDVSGAGAAYLFASTPDNTWVSTAYLKASNPGSLDWFGWALALGTDFVVVGAVSEHSASRGIDSKPDRAAEYSGALYVFR